MSGLSWRPVCSQGGADIGAGVQVFPQWVARLQAALAQRPGFLSLRVFEVVGDGPESEGRRVILLEMQGEAALAGWLQAPEKVSLLRDIAAVLRCPFQALRLHPVAGVERGSDA